MQASFFFTTSSKVQLSLGLAVSCGIEYGWQTVLTLQTLSSEAREELRIGHCGWRSRRARCEECKVHLPYVHSHCGEPPERCRG